MEQKNKATNVEVGFDEYMAISHGVLQYIEKTLSPEDEKEAQNIALKLSEDVMKEAYEKDLDWQVLVYGAIAAMTATMQAVSELLGEEE